jgi:phage FluMu protein Com
MDFKQVASFDNYVYANMTLGMLQENGINCHLKDEYIVTIDPLLNPAVGGIKLMVAVLQYERAIELIKEAESEYLRSVPCPKCKSLSLVAVEETDRPVGFWGRLKNQIAYGQTETYHKFYRCDHCGSVFPDIPDQTGQ